jgi:hypothetical protein
MSEQRLSREGLDTLRSYCLGHVEHSGDDATIVGVCDTALSLYDENERLSRPCHHIVTNDDGTSYCDLAEGAVVGLSDERDALRTQVAALREALGLYADPTNWREDDWGLISVFGAEYGSPGDRARAALAATPGDENDG